MKTKKITNHGTLMDSINFSALIDAQANTPAFVDNMCDIRKVNTKPEGVKTLSKVRKKSSSKTKYY